MKNTIHGCLALLVLVCLIGSGCSDLKAVGNSSVSKITPLGGGVYQFPADGWPQTLADFAKSHPEIRITAIGVAGQQVSNNRGAATSFVVVTEQREPVQPKSP